MMKKNIFISSLLFCIFFWFSSSFAIYYNIPYFARDASLGEATASSFGDITAIFYNPAVINSKSASFSLTEWFIDTRAGSLVGSYPVRDYLTIGGGLAYFSYGQMRYYDEYGNPLEYFSAGLWQYQLSIAKQFYNRVSLGVGLKGLHQKIADTNETKFIGDIGVIYYTNLFNIGVSVHDQTNISLDAGVSIKTKDFIWLAAINYKDEIMLKAGVEFNYKPMAFRIGYNDNDLSAGIGYNQKGYSFDYAITDHGLLGLTHHFSITIK